MCCGRSLADPLFEGEDTREDGNAPAEDEAKALAREASAVVFEECCHHVQDEENRGGKNKT